MNTRAKSEGYGDKVIQQLNQLRSREELCDFTVSAGEKSFQVIRGTTINIKSIQVIRDITINVKSF